MVSTRGVKYKFGEGEKVLCYEPDPTKAKVLYDSKVLEVVENKDKRGRKCIEYLIHFQGWNSSWDRCVREDFVLKDTEENRQLQKDLAEKSQLQIGAYLYRKERKKRSRKLSERIHDSLNSGGKIRRAGSSEDGSSGSTTGQRDVDTDDTQHDDGDSETCSSIDNIDSTDDDRIVIDLGDILRSHLEQDFERVKLQNKCYTLPADPNVVKILEHYVKHFAVSQLTMSSKEPSRGRNTTPNKKTRDFDKVCRNLNICKEVCDGLRIYFDFTLKDHLLYSPETEQYNELHVNDIKTDHTDIVIKKENMCIEDDEIKQSDSNSEPQSPSDIPLFAHLSVDTNNVSTNSSLNTRSTFNQQSSPTWTQSSPTSNANPTCNVSNHSANNCNSANSVSVTEPRRLRSHKTSCETQENDSMQIDVAVNNSMNVTVKEETAPSIATTSSRCSTPRNLSANRLGLNNISENSNNLNIPPKWNNVLQQVLAWKIIPEEAIKENPTAPSLLYGAIHLTRLLVKLPEFLSAAGLSEDKLSIVMEHLDMFIDYLEEHKEWYEETN